MTTYMIWCPELGETSDDAKPIIANDAGSAAEEWLERCDDYPTGPIDVNISDSNGIVTVRVWVEYVAVYCSSFVRRVVG